MTLNVIWAEFWDAEADEPGGEMHDLGAGEPDEVPALVRAGWHASVRHGFGEGEVYVTDQAGRRVALPV